MRRAVGSGVCVSFVHLLFWNPVHLFVSSGSSISPSSLPFPVAVSQHTFYIANVNTRNRILNCFPEHSSQRRSRAVV